MDLFCESSSRNIAINYIFEKAPSQMFDSVLSTPLDVVIVNRKNDFWYFSDFLLFGQVLENIHGEIWLFFLKKDKNGEKKIVRVFFSRSLVSNALDIFTILLTYCFN